MEEDPPRPDASTGGGASANEQPRRGNWLRGTAFLVGGSAPVLLLMCMDRHSALSVPLGSLGCITATVGVLDLLGTFGTSTESAPDLDWRRLRSPLVRCLAAALALYCALRLAVAGVLPAPRLSAGVAVTAAFGWLLVEFARLWTRFSNAVDLQQTPRPWWRRYGLWLLAGNALLALPMLGNFSLIDPWETHYGEVSREMLARDDWISLWWAQDGWFWSKPVLDFWIQGLSFSLFGVRYEPDQMIGSIATGAFPQPEWAARMPIFVMTLACLYFLYRGTARALGARAAFLGAAMLSTAPYWYFLQRQTMTDMPYVAPLAAMFGCFLLGWFSPPDARARSVRLALGSRSLTLSGFHALVGAVVLTALPQLLYLLSRNLTLQLNTSPAGFRWHLDEFLQGSGGDNCGLAGNQACRWVQAVNPNLQPAFTAVTFAAALALLLALLRDERRVRRLWYAAAWYFAALSAMAKGAPGLVIPVFVVGAFIVAVRRPGEFRDVMPATLLLLVVCIVLPWYVQMYARHGQPFIDRLLFHDMYQRAFVHVHDTNAGDDVSFRYYVWQLGYGLFPWSGLAVAGLLWWGHRELVNDHGELAAARAERETLSLCGLWFVTCFGLFSVSLTKFHHYILPAVPPLCVLGGVVLDRLLGPFDGRGELRDVRRRAVLRALGGALAALLSLYGASELWPGSILGGTGAEDLPPAARPWRGAAVLCVALALGVLGALRFGGERRREAEASAAQATALGAAGLMATVALALVGRDLLVELPGDVSNNARFMHLFTYNYDRPWPKTLDFGAAFFAASAVLVAAQGATLIRAWQARAAALLCAGALVCAAWAQDVYLVRAAPHWGQRETVAAYYRDRKSPKQPLVAFQMNWKGENFYTGNRLPAFVTTGKSFKDWLSRQRKRGVDVMYFTTEHTRLGTLKRELGKYKKFTLITDKTLNNKFFLARVAF